MTDPMTRKTASPPVLGSATDGVEVRLMEPVAGVGFWKDAWRRFLKSRMAVTGGVILIVVGITRVTRASAAYLVDVQV